MFQFSLAGVLKARATQEKVAQSRFAVISQKRNALLLEAEEINLGIESSLLELNDVSSKGIFGLHDYRRILEGVEILRNQLQEKEREITALEGEFFEARQKLMVAAQKKKVLEKLREKELDEFRQRQNKLEIDFLDEINSSRHGIPSILNPPQASGDV